MTTTLATPPRVRTTDDLARSLRIPKEQVELILEESERMGVVEHTTDGWKLSSSAERNLGRALRSMWSR